MVNKMTNIKKKRGRPAKTKEIDTVSEVPIPEPKPKSPRTSKEILEFLDKWESSRGSETVKKIKGMATNKEIMIMVPRFGKGRAMSNKIDGPIVVDGFTLDRRIPTIVQETPLIRLVCRTGLFQISTLPQKLVNKIRKMERR